MVDPLRIHQAYIDGDVGALRSALGDPADFPHTRGPQGLGENILEYAIYHAPIPLLRTLLELGADPNYEEDGGFPSLIAAITSGRDDTNEVVALLLEFGADPARRGANDQTPLHDAAATGDSALVELLLSHGADAQARTRVDDCSSPLEEAQARGDEGIARVLRRSMIRIEDATSS
jgi:ankyrin repeat protein